MKKLLIIALAIALCFSFSITAFAEGAADAGEYVSAFDLVAEFVAANCAEILSFLTFIGSVILAFTYKKGLLPKLSGALKGIGGSVGALKENTEKAVDVLSEKIDSVCKESKSTEELCESLSERILRLADELDEIKTTKGERRSMYAVLLAQVDMLYDIFMTSALPQYSKEAVSERINVMKAALAEAEEENA